MERFAQVYNKIGEVGIIPVIKLNRVEEAVPLAQALLAGGIPVAEVTFRTEAAAEGIATIRREFPQMLVGAGTVLSTEQATAAIDAGAQFVVSPGSNGKIIDRVLTAGVAMIPGVATPTEIEAAMEKGLRVLKFFPAEALGGIAMLKALSGPYPQIKFVPTGGISAGNMKEYLHQKNVLAVGGSWMIHSDLEIVQQLCQEAQKSVGSVERSI
ncbi:MAG: bifunctional 4-hydroxy-2-oxoglutarate aldolase/2-dehydro-3-deoxy-phosphogluconate aldolase [Spirochaetaceae bacterium]|nr:bifunctional 4-hydroxy-2-oxoglutarate aldolase/2-dehydro-3-deoxy-phosphogluconate aldolase [Spirochaetaceae bacterium]